MNIPIYYTNNVCLPLSLSVIYTLENWKFITNVSNEEWVDFKNCLLILNKYDLYIDKVKEKVNQIQNDLSKGIYKTITSDGIDAGVFSVEMEDFSSDELFYINFKLEISFNNKRYA